MVGEVTILFLPRDWNYLFQVFCYRFKHRSGSSDGVKVVGYGPCRAIVQKPCRIYDF